MKSKRLHLKTAVELAMERMAEKDNRDAKIEPVGVSLKDMSDNSSAIPTEPILDAERGHQLRSEMPIEQSCNLQQSPQCPSSLSKEDENEITAVNHLDISSAITSAAPQAQPSSLSLLNCKSCGHVNQGTRHWCGKCGAKLDQLISADLKGGGNRTLGSLAKNDRPILSDSKNIALPPLVPQEKPPVKRIDFDDLCWDIYDEGEWNRSALKKHLERKQREKEYYIRPTLFLVVGLMGMVIFALFPFWPILVIAVICGYFGAKGLFDHFWYYIAYDQTRNRQEDIQHRSDMEEERCRKCGAYKHYHVAEKRIKEWESEELETRSIAITDREGDRIGSLKWDAPVLTKNYSGSFYLRCRHCDDTWFADIHALARVRALD